MRFHWPRQKRLSITLAACLLIPIGVSAGLMFIPVGVQPDNKILLPSGQTITPAGDQIEVSDRPMGIAMSPNGIHAAVRAATFKPVY